ncbi:hypothetical protein KR084_003605 [Drosophila pseudotakahashii]|nr:hypothetical protein KR084_003605 [Drosophila pseudotakahashii]
MEVHQLLTSDILKLILDIVLMPFKDPGPLRMEPVVIISPNILRNTPTEEFKIITKCNITLGSLITAIEDFKISLIGNITLITPNQESKIIERCNILESQTIKRYNIIMSRLSI